MLYTVRLRMRLVSLPIAAFAILLGCATPPAPEPAPTPDTGASQFLTDATVFSELHADTLGRLDATVTRLISESAAKAKFRHGSLMRLLAIDAAAPADEQALQAS